MKKATVTSIKETCSLVLSTSLSKCLSAWIPYRGLKAEQGEQVVRVRCAEVVQLIEERERLMQLLGHAQAIMDVTSPKGIVRVFLENCVVALREVQE